MNHSVAKYPIFCWFMLFFPLYFYGCASLSNKDHSFHFDRQHAILSQREGWQVLQDEKEGVILWNEEHHATIVMLYSPSGNKKLTPDLLNHQLFIGIRNKDIVLKEPLLIDGKDALHSLLLGELDSRKFKFDSYTITGEGIVCDIVYFAPPDFFDDTHEDFLTLIQTFKINKR